MERTPLGAGYIGPHSGSESFFGSSTRIVSALADCDDRVTARSCLTVSIAHRLLYVQTSYRYVIEAYPSFMPTGRTDSGVREELRLVAAISQRLAGEPGGVSSIVDREQIAPIARNEVDRCISLMSGSVAETQGRTDPSEVGMMPTASLGGASVRFSTGLNQSLAINIAGREIQSRLAGLPANVGGPRPDPFTPSSLPEAMVYNHILLNTLSRPTNPKNTKGASDAVSMYLLYGHAEVLEMLGDPKNYPASLTTGYDKKWRTLGGMTVHMTMPGTGRLKIEISAAVVREPVMTDSDMGS